MKLRDLPRVVRGLFGPAEGSNRGPFSGVGELGGVFGMGPLEDGWQRALSVSRTEPREVAIVYACVMLYARVLSQCLPRHLRDTDGDAAEAVKTSPAARVMRTPNSYETWAQVILNTVCDMLFDGAAGWIIGHDERNAVSAIHRVGRNGWSPMVEPETGSVFYAVGDVSNGLIPKELLYAVPARNFAHFRMHTPRHPLIGESPIAAAAMALGINVALSRSQLAFFSQMRRPSGVLSTDAPLSPTARAQLRAAFDEQAERMNQGKVPILSNGLKFQTLSVNSVDSQLIESQKMSVLDIARVYGVPMALLSEGSGPQGGTEALINHWLSTGLGAVIESLERTIERAFGFGANDHIELDPSPLLRSDFNSRVDGLTKAISGGLLSPNEARARERLRSVKFGEEPRLQAQVVPLSQVDLAKPAASAPAPGAPTGVDDGEPEDDDPPETDDETDDQDRDESRNYLATISDIATATMQRAMQP